MPGLVLERMLGLLGLMLERDAATPVVRGQDLLGLSRIPSTMPRIPSIDPSMIALRALMARVARALHSSGNS